MSTLVALLFSEGAATMWLAYHPSPAKTDTRRAQGPIYPSIQHQNLGYRPSPGAAMSVVVANPNGSICYEAKYAIDSEGNRILESPPKPNNPALNITLFGDSVTFGEGLKDEETLQYFFGDHANVTNAAVYGYGPQHTLAILEDAERKFRSDGKQIGVYVLIPDHYRRALGSFHTDWLYNGPYYHFDRLGDLKRSGTFDSDRAFITGFYRSFTVLRRFSKLAQLIDPAIIFENESAGAKLVAAILHESAVRFEHRTGGTFYVVIHPSWHSARSTNLYQESIDALRAQTLPIMDYSTWDYGLDETIGNGCDGHPNGKLNKRLAQAIVDDLSSRMK